MKQTNKFNTLKIDNHHVIHLGKILNKKYRKKTKTKMPNACSCALTFVIRYLFREYDM